jgi:hypothetical protein
MLSLFISFLYELDELIIKFIRAEEDLSIIIVGEKHRSLYDR